jgi:hypothetical protein
MTSASMLAYVRTMLDEAQASFWSDAQIYAALTAGQERIVNLALATFLAKQEVNPNTDVPHLLVPLLSIQNLLINNSTGTAQLPNDYLQIVYAGVSLNNGACGPILRRRMNYHTLSDQNNSLLTATTGQTVGEYIGYIVGTTFYLEQTFSSGTNYIKLTYIAQPQAISSTQQPVLPMEVHEPICEFAFATLLSKDQREQEAAMEFQKFASMIQAEIS